LTETIRTTEARQNGKILTPTFLILCFLFLCSSSVTYMVNTIFSDYALVRLGTTISLAGTLAGMTNIGAFIILPFCGPANNRMDKKKLLQVAALIFALTTMGFALFDSIPVIMLLRLISGFGTGLAFTSGMVMVVEALPESRITEGVGYYGLAGIIMEAIGPTIALFMVSTFSYAAAFLTAGAISFIGFLVSFKLPSSKPSCPVSIPGKEPAKKEKLTLALLMKEIIAKESILPATIGALFALINGIQHAFVVPYAKSMNLEAGAGIYFTVIAITLFLARLLLGKFIQKRTIAFAVVFSGIFLTLCPILLGLGTSMVTMLLGGAFFGIGYGTLLPVTQSTAVKFAPANRRGSGSSTYFLGIRLAFAIGPSLGGLFAQNFGYARMFLILVIPSLLAIVLGVVKGRIPINPEHAVSPISVNQP
jgi:MFS family permease